MYTPSRSATARPLPGLLRRDPICRVVGIDHGRERAPNRSRFGPVSGLSPEQVDVVGDQHNVAGIEVRVETPAALVSTTVSTPERQRGAQQESRLALRVALVGMRPAGQQDRGRTGDGTGDRLAGVAFDGRARERAGCRGSSAAAEARDRAARGHHPGRSRGPRRDVAGGGIGSASRWRLIASVASPMRRSSSAPRTSLEIAPGRSRPPTSAPAGRASSPRTPQG